VGGGSGDCLQLKGVEFGPRESNRGGKGMKRPGQRTWQRRGIESQNGSTNKKANERGTKKTWTRRSCLFSVGDLPRTPSKEKALAIGTRRDGFYAFMYRPQGRPSTSAGGKADQPSLSKFGGHRTCFVSFLSYYSGTW